MPGPAKQKTALKDKPPPFEICDTQIKAGTVGRLEIPVARLPTGSWLSVPVVVIHGRRPGPSMWLNAAIHGDELNGIPVIHRVVRMVDPKELSGTLLCVPVVNVFGLINGSRYLPDRRDLNRSFPGSKRGSLAGQLARLFIEEVVQRCEFGIDLHTGSDGRTNLPQIRCDLDEPTTREAAIRFGAPLVLHSGLRDGSLRAAASDLGIRLLVYETGEALRFDPAGVRLGVDGVLRVISWLGMRDGSELPDASPPFISRKSGWVRARRSGFCELTVELGQRVSAGEELAVIIDATGAGRTPIHANRAGIVIGHQSSALVHRGDAVAHIAEEAAD